jgi:hypothetical protein
VRFLGTVTVFVCLALAATVLSAKAQSWGRGGAYAGAGGTSQGYYPRSGVHSCTWSVTAACSAWRNGVAVTRTSNGVVATHRLIKKFPNGRYTLQKTHN